MADPQTTFASEGERNLRATEFRPLLFSDDHTSEGFLAPLDNGNIMLIFRMDPGISGDHVGTGGYIASITYDPQQDRWGKSKRFITAIGMMTAISTEA